MGRSEQPVAGTNPAVVAFARQLRALRSAAGNPTYRVMAGRAYASRTCLSAAASGQQLPTLTMALAFVRACGGDIEQWRVTWMRAHATSKTFGTKGSTRGTNRIDGVGVAGGRELVGPVGARYRHPVPPASGGGPRSRRPTPWRPAGT